MLSIHSTDTFGEHNGTILVRCLINALEQFSLYWDIHALNAPNQFSPTGSEKKLTTVVWVSRLRSFSMIRPGIPINTRTDTASGMTRRTWNMVTLGNGPTFCIASLGLMTRWFPNFFTHSLSQPDLMMVKTSFPLLCCFQHTFFSGKKTTLPSNTKLGSQQPT